MTEATGPEPGPTEGADPAETSRPLEQKAPLEEAALRAGTLCVVGNLNRDLKTAPFGPGPHLFRDGETSVGAVVETIGGGGANSACIAAGLGARAALLAKIGADALGAQLQRTLRRHGVQPHLIRDPQLRTGTSIALSFDNGQRHFLSWLPNAAALRFEELDLRALDGFDHLYRADVWFSEPMLFGGNERLFRAARARGLIISLDLNWDPRWGAAAAEEIQRRKQAVRAVLPLVHLVHGNARELQEFADAPSLDTALRRLADWGAGAVVAHLGRLGAGCYSQGRLLVEPPVPAARQVNTTGTGDVLSVCLMLLHRQPDLRAKLRLANRIVAEFIEGHRHLIPALEAPKPPESEESAAAVPSAEIG